MSKNAAFFKATTRIIVAASLMVGAIVLMAFPLFSFAAIFAYVNQSGEVSTVTADTATTALMTAPNIDEHSGVLLLTNPSDGVVGDTVPGV